VARRGGPAMLEVNRSHQRGSMRSRKEGPVNARHIIIALALFLFVASPQPIQSQIVEGNPYPNYDGPRKTIAVSRFDAVGSFVGEYGGWDIGGGLAAMLVAELVRTNRFVVVERAELDMLLREQQMALSDVTRGASGAPLLGAQTFIRGSVTEFAQQERGGGLNVGLNLPGVSGGLGSRQASGHITIDLRLIDAATGTVVSTVQVKKTIRSSSLALQGRTGVISFGGDQFDQTSLGRASREAITEAVTRITAEMVSVPWQALVANVETDRVYINAGRSANVTPGASMRAVRVERTITDPASGEVLGGELRTIGDLTIEQVEDRYSIGRWLGQEPPRRGDVVHLIGGSPG
jgi:curli biogenesis system outer membrane secretion channel CsgG